MASIKHLMSQVVANPKAVVAEEQHQIHCSSLTRGDARSLEKRPAQALVPEVVLAEVDRLVTRRQQRERQKQQHHQGSGIPSPTARRRQEELKADNEEAEDWMTPLADDIEEIGGGGSPKNKGHKNRKTHSLSATTPTAFNTSATAIPSTTMNNSTTTTISPKPLMSNPPATAENKKELRVNRQSHSGTPPCSGEEGVGDVRAKAGGRIGFEQQQATRHSPAASAAARAMTPLGTSTLTPGNGKEHHYQQQQPRLNQTAGGYGLASHCGAPSPSRSFTSSEVGKGKKYKSGQHYLDSALALLGKCPRRDLNNVMAVSTEVSNKNLADLKAFERRKRKKNPSLAPVTVTAVGLAAIPLVASSLPPTNTLHVVQRNRSPPPPPHPMQPFSQEGCLDDDDLQRRRAKKTKKKINDLDAHGKETEEHPHQPHQQDVSGPPPILAGLDDSIPSMASMMMEGGEESVELGCVTASDGGSIVLRGGGGGGTTAAASTTSATGSGVSSSGDPKMTSNLKAVKTTMMGSEPLQGSSSGLLPPLLAPSVMPPSALEVLDVSQEIVLNSSIASSPAYGGGGKLSSTNRANRSVTVTIAEAETEDADDNKLVSTSSVLSNKDKTYRSASSSQGLGSTMAGGAGGFGGGGGDSSSTRGGEGSIRRESAASNVAELTRRASSMGGSFYKLERRAARSKRFAEPGADGSLSKLAVTLEDLVLIVRVASLDAAKRSEHVVTSLVTHNYGLGWIYDLTLRPNGNRQVLTPPPPLASSPRVDGDLSNGGGTMEGRPVTPQQTFVNSPLLAHSSNKSHLLVSPHSSAVYQPSPISSPTIAAATSEFPTLDNTSSTGNTLPTPTAPYTPAEVANAAVAVKKKKLIPWITLDNMAEDYLDCGGNPEDAVALLNSPRSALTFLRNGVHPMALQRKPFATLRAQLSIQGMSSNDIRQRYDFLETFRKNELESLRNEYRELCKMLPRNQLNIFFELIDPLGGMIGLPKLVWDSVKGHYVVEVAGDDALAAAMDDMRERMEADKRRVGKTLKVEIDARERLTHLHELEMAKNVSAGLRQLERTQTLAEEKSQTSQIRRMALDMKHMRLDEVKKTTEAKRLQEIAVREERARLAEAAQQAAALEQRERRHHQLAERQQLRAERVVASTAKAEKIMRNREQSLIEKDLYRQRQIQRKQEAQAVKRKERQLEMRLIEERRADIIKKAEVMLREREIRAKQVQEKVEKRLVEFAHEKQVASDLRNICDMAREINREEVAVEAKILAEQRVALQLIRRETQEERFQRRKAVQARDREIKVEQTKQVNELKVNYVEKKERQRQLKELAIADKQLRAVKQAEALEETQVVLVEKARAERAHLMLFRRSKLTATVRDIQEKERQSYFTTFNQGRGPQHSPSPTPSPKKNRRGDGGSSHNHMQSHDDINHRFDEDPQDKQRGRSVSPPGPPPLVTTTSDRHPQALQGGGGGGSMVSQPDRRLSASQPFETDYRPVAD